MKKIFFVLPVIIFIFISVGCKDDSTSTQKSTVTTTNIQRKPDTLSIYIDIQNTTYSFSDSAANLQFTGIPKIIYEVRPTNGYGSLNLYNNLDSTIYYMYFTGFKSDSTTLSDIPLKYSFKITNFTGNGSIKVVR
jgi:hypothetical protein